MNYKMTETTRRYVYEDTYQEIINWAKLRDIKTPNRKDNFPYSLKEYIKHLKGE